MNEQWIKDKDNQKKLLGVLIAINLFAVAGLLIVTATNSGPLYEVIKPDVKEEYYIYLDQDIMDNVLVLSVVPIDADKNVIGEEQQIKLTDRHGEIPLDKNSHILVTRIVQITGEEQTHVSSYTHTVINENITIPDGFTTYYTDEVEVF